MPKTNFKFTIEWMFVPKDNADDDLFVKEMLKSECSQAQKSSGPDVTAPSLGENDRSAFVRLSFLKNHIKQQS